MDAQAHDIEALRKAHNAASLRRVNMSLKVKRFCHGTPTDYHDSLRAALAAAERAESEALNALLEAGGKPYW